MKRFWTAMAVGVCVIFGVAGCNDYGNTFQSPGGAALSFLSPSQIPASACTTGQSCPSFTLTLNGSGFVPQTRVQWNQKTCPTSTSAGASTAGCITNITLDVNNNVTALTATITGALYSKPGIATVNTINPNSNYGTGTNGLSNTINFIIGNPPNPIPTVASVSPTCVVAGNALTLSVTGTNFLNGSTDPSQVSTVNWILGGSQLQLTAPSASTATQISVMIPATSINAAGNASVSVYNPPSPPVSSIPGSVGSGGGTSTPAVTVTVQAAGTTCATAAKATANSALQAAVSEETPAVSLDGRYVAYTAVQGEHAQIFLRDTCEGASSSCQPQSSLLSVTSDGEAASGDSHTPSMSSDGRYIAFSSDATDLIENAPAGRQIYLHDTCIGADASCKASTILVSTDSGGALAGAESIMPSISSSGRFVAFLAVTASHAPNRPSAEAKSSNGATNSGYRQVFVRDTCLGMRATQTFSTPGFVLHRRGDLAQDGASCTPKTTRISVQPGDGGGTDGNAAGPALSGQAKNVAMTGAKTSTLFTRSVPVDDSVFLAITKDQQ